MLQLHVLAEENSIFEESTCFHIHMKKKLKKYNSVFRHPYSWVSVAMKIGIAGIIQNKDNLSRNLLIDIVTEIPNQVFIRAL